MFELAQKLMSIPSVTGGEKEIGLFLSNLLHERRYRVEKQFLIPNRFNVLGFAGKPRVILCTHIDTVPPQLPVREDANFLYGRGACDTKGIIAAMLEAGDRLRSQAIDNFGFLFVVGEEGSGDGAKQANKLSWESEFVIVGEPTGNKLAVAQKGILMADISCKGRAAHSGYPEEGVSAVTGLWSVLQECSSADWGTDPDFGKGTFNIGVFTGGEACNIVPGEASASVMIRLVEPRVPAEQRLRKIVGNRADVKIVGGSDPFRLHSVDGFETMVASFGSDAPYLSNLGKPLLIGPGSILDAHTSHEKISRKEMIEGAAIYERLVKKLLS
ncbi:MAG TPA: M20/M25/M40 family metallo-hydrolase [Terriglobia bacterium]|nr:M20/M25/M40 family metallo-hydrolase [Terriglobia bacterium]